MQQVFGQGAPRHTPSGPEPTSGGRLWPPRAPSPVSSLPSQPPPSTAAERLERPNALAAAHARFARAALAIYLATAAVSVALLVVALVTDKAHDEDQTREQLLLETDVRAHSLSQRLDLLVNELRRLSQRSEVDLRDQDLAPEKSLLALSHERSTFFNLGVAILDRKGEVVWSEPEAFLARGASFANEKWFGTVRRSRAFRIVAVAPDRPDSVLYVVSPLVKGPDFTGALLGAVDLARGAPLGADEKPANKSLTVLAARDGAVVYPPVPPQFAAEAPWRELFTRMHDEPFTERIVLEGAPRIVAASPVSGTDLVLMSIGRQDELFLDARTRLRTRLLAGLSLAMAPALLLLFLLRRSLKLFQKSEEDAVREERLRLLGEAANSIAHEVKNALNGLSMGLDLVVRTFTQAAAPAAAGGPPVSIGGKPATERSAADRRERIVGELRREIQRLSEFTTELMTFSRGVELRRVKVDLADFVPKVTGLLRDAAEEEGGAEIDLIEPSEPVWVEGDAALLHAVISNLAGNALDAATAHAPKPRVEIRLEARDGVASLRVTDNGRGVSPTMQGRLFEPFQSEKPNGVGIGLALSRKIARAHGGDLILAEAQSKRPSHPGASFLLTLPLTTAPEEEEA
jgi:two-component system C4-dicarboxylate transport sensor histidine kinase DctB